MKTEEKGDNQLHEAPEEAGKSRILSGSRKPVADRREDSETGEEPKEAHAGNLWVGGESPREFQADGDFLCTESEVDELGISGLKRSEKEQHIHCGTPGRERQQWKTEESLGSIEVPDEIVNHAFIVKIVT